MLSLRLATPKAAVSIGSGATPAAMVWESSSPTTVMPIWYIISSGRVRFRRSVKTFGTTMSTLPSRASEKMSWICAGSWPAATAACALGMPLVEDRGLEFLEQLEAIGEQAAAPARMAGDVDSDQAGSEIIDPGPAKGLRRRKARRRGPRQLLRPDQEVDAGQGAGDPVAQQKANGPKAGLLGGRGYRISPDMASRPFDSVGRVTRGLRA